MQPQIEITGMKHLCFVPRSSDMKFHKIWSRDCGEMASDGCTHRWRLHVYAPPKFLGSILKITYTIHLLTLYSIDTHFDTST